MYKILLICIIICFVQFNGLYSQDKRNPNYPESIKTPVIDIIPSVITLEKDTTRFVVINVTVLNRGIGILNLSGVSGSCYCSNGVIEKNDIRFLDSGTLRLEINKDGLQNDDDTVKYTVSSNAKNSPFFITVKFVENKQSKISDEK